MQAFEQPFRHWIADDWAPPALVRAADQSWPDEFWEWWHRYEGPDAVKLGTRDPSRLTPACAELARMLLSIDTERELGVAGCFPDFGLHGAGMHAIPAGGFLGLHLDGDRHPLKGWRRRLSAMLYVNERWQPEWGGSLQLGQSKVIEARFNRLVIFECGDHALHGVPEPVRCPAGEQRRSVAAFWWSPADGGGTRDRAAFVGGAR